MQEQERLAAANTVVVELHRRKPTDTQGAAADGRASPPPASREGNQNIRLGQRLARDDARTAN
jgi:hypothetical protein